MSLLQQEKDRWFEQEVQAHEPILRAWLRSRFCAAHDVDDVIQESFLRVLQARQATEIASPKAFLFATARNVVFGRARRQKASREKPLAETDAGDILDETADVPHHVARAQELELLKRAIQSLPPRCREILTLRKIHGLSQREVAAQLGIAEHTVEAQGTIALRKIAVFFERLERKPQLST
jgi:RNA polymerase sigma factor (sigma-70 family)